MLISRLYLGIWGVICLMWMSGAGAQIKWDFEGENLTWRPRSAGVKLELSEESQTPHGRRALHITGTDENNWNYALSESQPMQAGQAYRLSVWMRVTKMAAETQAPAVKCEFVPADGQGTLGRVTTPAYDVNRLGEWQKLETEFRAPAGVGSFWLAVEKGGNTSMSIDMYIDEVLVEPINELTVFQRYDLEPLPVPLQKYTGKHPRLYLQAEQIEQLRQASRTTQAAQWQRLQALADRYVQSGPPAYRERDSYSGDEQLWQREVGNAMPTLAMAWLITQDRRYLESVQAWALASCGYPTWGLGRIDGMDLAAGHQLFGLGIVYDWCYAALSEQARQTIRETLLTRAARMFEAAATGNVWWHRAYLQNHLWVNAAGLAVAGLALYDELPAARRWIGLALDKFAQTMEYLGPDGASHEGVGYWQYGVEYMLKFMALAKDLLERDLYHYEWWRHTAYYALYLQLPRQAWTRRNCIVDIADCPRNNWYGPDYLLWELARRFQNPYAQWLANEIFAADIASGGAPWLNLLWRDPHLEARPPADLPTLRHFADLGIVSARSDWSGQESLLVFKCGPFLGHEAVKKLNFDAGGGHVHPDANHFVLFGAGEWLIRDEGYASKWTGQHNTLLVDGQGQWGEGQRWLQGAVTLRLPQQPRILRVESTPHLDYIVGDATAAYPEKLGLKRFVRHLLFMKPDVLIVLDDIEADQPQALELRFHPEQQKAEEMGTAFLCRGQNAVLRLEPLIQADVRVTGEIVSGQDRHAQELPLFTIRLQTQRPQWRQATALSWGASDKPPVAVKLISRGDIWMFEAEGRKAGYDWAKHTLIQPEEG